MVSRATNSMKTTISAKGSMLQLFLLSTIWLSNIHDAVAREKPLEPTHFSSKLASPPKTGLFEPIEISPAIIPHYPFPGEPLAPMYPSFPTPYDPVLTGRCPVNFSVISSILDKTSSDCSQPLAPLVGNVICCPQFSSLLHIFQGYYSTNSDKLVLHSGIADDCFNDIISILASRGANSSISSICSVKSSNLTGGSCPVKDMAVFEKAVNTSKLLEACKTVDPLKECCRPLCQPAIMEAALQISVSQLAVVDNNNYVGEPYGMNALNDCKGVVYSWLSRKLPIDDANTVFRILSACKVNKVCPLDFKQPTEVLKACRNGAAPSPSCCSSLNSYIAGIQKQMLITNKQAILCATVFGSMLQKGGVMTNIYELCDVDLKDFSIQGRVSCHFFLFVMVVTPLLYLTCYFVLAILHRGAEAAFGQQGCLLRSLPADVVYDNSTGFSFTCDLSDNIAAPWPLSSSISSFSLCAPEMSLPALPTSQTLRNAGHRHGGLEFLVPILSFLVFSMFLN